MLWNVTYIHNVVKYIGLIILAYNIVIEQKPMLCIETWSFGMGLDV